MSLEYICELLSEFGLCKLEKHCAFDGYKITIVTSSVLLFTTVCVMAKKKIKAWASQATKIRLLKVKLRSRHSYIEGFLSGCAWIGPQPRVMDGQSPLIAYRNDRETVASFRYSAFPLGKAGQEVLSSYQRTVISIMKFQNKGVLPAKLECCMPEIGVRLGAREISVLPWLDTSTRSEPVSQRRREHAASVGGKLIHVMVEASGGYLQRLDIALSSSKTRRDETVLVNSTEELRALMKGSGLLSDDGSFDMQIMSRAMGVLTHGEILSSVGGGASTVTIGCDLFRGECNEAEKPVYERFIETCSQMFSTGGLLNIRAWAMGLQVARLINKKYDDTVVYRQRSVTGEQAELNESDTSLITLKELTGAKKTVTALEVEVQLAMIIQDMTDITEGMQTRYRRKQYHGLMFSLRRCARYPGGWLYGVHSYRLPGRENLYRYDVHYCTPAPHVAFDILRKYHRTGRLRRTNDLETFKWLVKCNAWLAANIRIISQPADLVDVSSLVVNSTIKAPGMYTGLKSEIPFCYKRKDDCEKNSTEAGELDLEPSNNWYEAEYLYIMSDFASKVQLERVGRPSQCCVDGVWTIGVPIKRDKYLDYYVRVPNGAIPHENYVSRYFWGCVMRHEMPKSTTPMGALLQLFPSARLQTLEAGERVRRLSVLPRSDVSVGHMVHVDIYTAIWAAGMEWPVFLDSVLQWDDLLETTLSSIYLWFMNLPTHLKVIVESWAGWNSKSWTDWYKSAKAISVAVKALQGLVLVDGMAWDLTPLFEMDVLINRVVAEIDWKQEQHNRVLPTHVNLEPVCVYSHCKEAFVEALTKRDAVPNKQEWKSFWKNRWIHTPPGAFYSVHGHDKWFSDSISKREYKNKKIVCSAMPNDMPLNEFIKHPPRIYAKTLPKYEWGKNRALYPCDYTSYVIADYGFLGCEDCMPSMCVAGSEADKSVVVPRMRRLLKNRLPYCLDFEDFNSQHSISSMQAVLQAYVDVFRSLLTFEQILCIEWTIRSLHTQVITLPNGTQFTANGTLLSGWRLTSFVNTMLNFTYFRAAQEWAVTNRGKYAADIAALHSGDDVFCTISTYRAVQDLQAGMVAIGARLQHNKCFVGAVAEFLRVDANGTEATGTQYLSRSCATLVHGRIETSAPTDCRALLEAIITRAREVAGRGGNASVIQRCLSMQLADVLGNWPITIADLQSVIELPLSYGGISSLGRDAILPNVIIRTISSRPLTEIEVLGRLPGIQSAAESLASRLELEDHIGRVVAHLAYTTAQLAGCMSAYPQAIPVPSSMSTQIRRSEGKFEVLSSVLDYRLAKLSGLLNILMLCDSKYMAFRNWKASLQGDADEVCVRAALGRRTVLAHEGQLVMSM